jgi:hypothetical protein
LQTAIMHLVISAPFSESATSQFADQCRLAAEPPRMVRGYSWLQPTGGSLPALGSGVNGSGRDL